MTSKLTFYQCEITPEKNCVVDDLVGYLSSLTPLVVENFQYIKLDLRKQKNTNHRRSI